MFASRRPLAPRSLLVALAVAVTVPVLSVPGVAGADDDVSTGDIVVGEFAQVWPEYENPDDAAEHGDEGPLSFVHTEDGDSVRVDTEDVEDLEVGATVELTVGREVRDTASAEMGYDKARQVVDTEILAAAPAPPATAPATPPFTNSVTVVMVVPAGGTQDSTTLSQVEAAVNGPVADFWEEQSNGEIKIGVTASHDWITTSARCAEPYALWREVATRVNFVGGPGKHLMLYVTKTPGSLPGCFYGLAEVGGSIEEGGRLYVRDTVTSVIAHELGHNFGLGHSSAQQCNAALDTGTCRTVPYGDYYDVMGVSWDQVGTLNVAQASHAGLLPPGSWTELGFLSPETVLTLQPVSGHAGMRAAALWAPDGTPHWLEYRPAAGRDGWLATGANTEGLEPGVLLRRSSDTADTSLLLDGTPSASAGWDADLQSALVVGTPVVAAGGTYRITWEGVSAGAATVRVVATSPITHAYNAAGGSGGALGAPTGAETCGLAGAGCVRTYQNGDIFWSWTTGARTMSPGPVKDFWTSAGADGGPLGLPTGNTRCGLAGGGCVQDFQGGTVSWSAATGAHATYGAIRGRWSAAAQEAGPLGYPQAAMTCHGARCWQPFQGGEVTWAPAAGTRTLHGGIRGAWHATGGGTGALGAAATDMVCGLNRSGCGQHFEGGSLFWSPTTGTQAMYGAIRDRWFRQNGQDGSLAYPTGNMFCTWHCIQYYQGGTIVWSASTGAVVVTGAIAGRWQADGATAGGLGLPTGEIVCGLNRGGCAQHYQGGSIYWSPATGAHAVHGAIKDAYWRQRGQDGRLGYPLFRTACSGSTCRQAFQGGEITWTAARGTSIRFNR